MAASSRASGEEVIRAAVFDIAPEQHRLVVVADGLLTKPLATCAPFRYSACCLDASSKVNARWYQFRARARRRVLISCQS